MAETTSVACPNCAARFKVPIEKLGKTFKCPKCTQPFVAATTGPAAPAAPAAPVAPSSPTRAVSSSALRLDEPPPVRVKPPKQPAYEPPPAAAAEPEYTEPVAAYKPSKTAAGDPGSGLAVAALIFSLTGCLWPVGMVLGIVGLIKAKNGTAGGRGMSMAAVVISGVMLILGIGAVSILLPALNKARDSANRALCASHMHLIGGAMAEYAGRYNEYPPDLTTLAKAEHLSPGVFVCPASNEKAAASVDQIEAGGHCSYVYTGRYLAYPGTGDVLFENDADHEKQGGNILRSDGIVEWTVKADDDTRMATARAAAELRKAPPSHTLKKFVPSMP